MEMAGDMYDKRCSLREDGDNVALRKLMRQSTDVNIS